MKAIPLMLGFVLVVTTGAVAASKFETDENGFAKAKAEFLMFDVAAVSHCHDSAARANGAIEKLNALVEDILLKFGTGTAEQEIQSFAGHIEKAQLTKYEGGRTIVVCDGFRSSSHFFFKLVEQSRVADLQDALLALNRPGDDKEVVSLSRPRAGIFSSTYEALVDAALKDAHQKAKRRVGVLMSDMPGIATASLVKVASTTNSAGSVAYDQTGLSGDPQVSAAETVSVSITRKFVFSLK